MNKLDKIYNKPNMELIKLEINQTRQNIEIKIIKLKKQLKSIFLFIISIHNLNYK